MDGRRPRYARPIHYLGSKLRLVDLIQKVLDEVDPSSGRVCDLFAGSGAVSAALADSRAVTAVDIQEYSRVLCSALLSRRAPLTCSSSEFVEEAFTRPIAEQLRWAVAPLIDYEAHCLARAALGDLDPFSQLLDGGCLVLAKKKLKDGASQPVQAVLRESLSRLESRGLLTGPSTVITRYYGGTYFSYEQAVQLDVLLAAADQAGRAWSDVVLAAAVGAASDVVNTIGKQFAQPIRLRTRGGDLKHHLGGKILRDRALSVVDTFSHRLSEYIAIPPSERQHEAIRDDYATFLATYRQPVGVIYADPPYTRDHYSRYYHVLETMCLRDEPGVSASNLNGGLIPSRGVYRAVRHQSPFCIKTEAPRAFQRLMQGARAFGVPLVMSYSPYDQGSHPRLLTVDSLVEIARQHYSHVDVSSVGKFWHSKLNASENALVASDEAEVLVICKP